MSIKKIILVQHTHTDIGYTGLHHEVTVQHIRHIRSALDHCQKDDRFRWTIETGWTLESFLTVATPSEKDCLLKYIHNGQIELTGLYDQPFLQLCNLEELCASLELTSRLIKGMPAAAETALVTDVGGLSYNFPQILNYYNIRNCVIAPNNWRLMFAFTNLPRLFRLTGPDGSNILLYLIGNDTRNTALEMSPSQYGYGVVYFLWPMLNEIDGKEPKTEENIEIPFLHYKGREGIDTLLERLAYDQYPYDTLLLQVATDNVGPFDRLLEAIDEWNDRYGDPEIVLGTTKDFFQDIEQRYGNSIQSIQGEITCPWTEHAITSAGVTGRYREARRRLNTWAALDYCRQKQSDLAPIWWAVMKNIVLYSDHCWALSMFGWYKMLAQYGSFWDEAFDKARDSWQSKARYAEDALSLVRREQDIQTIEISVGDIDFPEKITVFNPHSFVYNGMVRFESCHPEIELVRNDGSRLPVESRKVNPARWYFHKVWLDKLDPYAIEVFEVRTKIQKCEMECVCVDWTLKSPSATVVVSSQTGGILSFQTLGQQGEWVDTSYGHLNEIHYFRVEGISDSITRCGMKEGVNHIRIPVHKTRKVGSADGVLSTSMMVERYLISGEYTIIIETQYLLDGTGLRINNRVRKIHALDKEACYFAFPLRMSDPYRFDIEQQGQVTHFPEERLPGSSNHNLGIQDFVSVSDENSQVVLTTMQATIAALGKPTYYHYGLDFPAIEHPAVFFYAFNNLWNTNCALHQDGDLVFEFHVSCFEGEYSPVTAYHASRQATQPPRVFAGDTHGKGFVSDNTNLIRLSTDQVIVESIRPEDTGTWQLRLAEIGRQKTSCQVTLSSGRFIEFAIQSRYTADPAWQSATDNPINLDFRPAEFKTLLLKTKRSSH